MKLYRMPWCFAGMASAIVSPAVAQAQKPAASQVARVADCLDVADDTARLACFDREARALRTAVAEKKVVVVQQADIKKARRTLFGIALPRIDALGGDDEPEKEITATIKSVAQDRDGRLNFTLDDGALWAQADDWPLAGAVKPGQKVILKRGAFGTYFADFERAPTVRARRVR